MSLVRGNPVTICVYYVAKKGDFSEVTPVELPVGQSRFRGDLLLLPKAGGAHIETSSQTAVRCWELCVGRTTTSCVGTAIAVGDL